MIKAAAEEPEVERIFVNAAIKKALCETPQGRALDDESGRPIGGTIITSVSGSHVRLVKPPASRRRLFRRAMAAASRWPGGSPTRRCIPRSDPNAKPKPPLTLAQLRPECRNVVLEK